MNANEAHEEYRDWFATTGGDASWLVVGLRGDDDDTVDEVQVSILTVAPGDLVSALRFMLLTMGHTAPPKVFVHGAHTVDDWQTAETYIALTTVGAALTEDLQEAEVNVRVSRWSNETKKFELIEDDAAERVAYALGPQKDLLATYLNDVTNLELAAEAQNN